MSQSRVVEFSTAPIEPHEVDLLARLYHEIGLSAVAAALEILNAPSQSSEAAPRAFESGYISAPHEESLAA
jgi:hypothetical protein